MFYSFIAGFMIGLGIMASILLHNAVNLSPLDPSQVLALGLSCCFSFALAGVWVCEVVKDLRNKGDK